MLTAQELLAGYEEVRPDLADLRSQHAQEVRELIYWLGDRPSGLVSADALARMLQMPTGKIHFDIGTIQLHRPGGTILPFTCRLVASNAEAVNRFISLLHLMGQRIPDEWRAKLPDVREASPHMLALAVAIIMLSECHPVLMDKQQGYTRIRQPMDALLRLLDTKIGWTRDAIAAQQKPAAIAPQPEKPKANGPTACSRH